jgi:hypothetical protein
LCRILIEIARGLPSKSTSEQVDMSLARAIELVETLTAKELRDGPSLLARDSSPGLGTD